MEQGSQGGWYPRFCTCWPVTMVGLILCMHITNLPDIPGGYLLRKWFSAADAQKGQKALNNYFQGVWARPVFFAEDQRSRIRAPGSLTSILADALRFQGHQYLKSGLLRAALLVLDKPVIPSASRHGNGCWRCRA